MFTLQPQWTKRASAAARWTASRSVILVTLLNVLAVVIALGVVWVPEVWHYRVTTRDISQSEMSSVRADPREDVVAEVGGMSLAVADLPEQPVDIVMRAEAALRGR